MTNKEKIIAEIERLKKELYKQRDFRIDGSPIPVYDTNAIDGMLKVLDEVKGFINSIAPEQQSNSLDNFIRSLLETYPTNKNEVPIEALNDYHQGLICGARKTYNWILESAIKIDAVIINDETSGCVVDCEQGCLVLEPNTYPIGQKLKILIIKEDE